MKIDVQFLSRCIQALEKALNQLAQIEEEAIEYDYIAPLL